MSYQVWDAYQPGSGFASVEELSGLSDKQDGCIFFGKALGQPIPSVAIKKLTRGTLPDTLGTVTSSRLVSARLRAVLEKFSPEGIQFVRATLPRASKRQYFIANITMHAACFDRDRSEYRTFVNPPTIRAIKRMALKPIPPDAPAIFHLLEVPAVMMVRDDLRQAMQSVSPSSGIYTAVSQFSFGVW